MKVLLFGATGMVGQSVLRECLLDPEVETVLAIGRSPVGREHAKLRELVAPDLFDLSGVEDRLRGFDACFFCLGVSSAGMSEADYRRVTFDLTLSAARTLSRLNPGMTFTYLSGANTDSTGRGRTMWGRVKGETENALLRLPFKAAYMFRLGALLPLRGIRSKTPIYNVLYAVAGPLLPAFKAVFPRSITTSEQLGRAMIAAAKRGAPKAVLEVADINELGSASGWPG